MAQTWRDLLFAHWPLPAEAVGAVLPPGLVPDTFDGQAWVGVTPFEIAGLRLRGIPPIPGTSRFPELNVRTYITVNDRPGIYFLSLDAGNPLAALAARRAYRLPYFHARMQIRRYEETIHFLSSRTAPDGEPAAFEATYRPSGPPSVASPGSLAHFLTERYCLYTLDDRAGILRGEIHHPAWPLQPATATIVRNSMTKPWRLELPRSRPVLHFASLQNVLIWPLRPVEKP
jgi:uncharacterized protein YqjF (DUF2071 family)